MLVDGRAVRVLACVVAYDPDSKFEVRVNKIASQVDHVLVVNNFEGRDMRSNDYSVIDNGNKGGIAGALNRALEYARKEGYDYLALFDHDSDVPSGMIVALVSSLVHSDGALVGPIYKNSATGRAGRFVLDIQGRPVSRFLDRDIGVVPAYFIITSGTVIKVDSIPIDFSYNEMLGLDMVDVDFCLGLRHRGSKIYLHTGVLMSHGIGNKMPGSRRIDPPNYSLNRHKIIIRNRILLWRKWFRFFKAYVFLDIFVAALDFIRNLLFIKERLNYIKAFSSGVIHGFKGEVSSIVGGGYE